MRRDALRFGQEAEDAVTREGSPAARRLRRAAPGLRVGLGKKDASAARDLLFKDVLFFLLFLQLLYIS